MPEYRKLHNNFDMGERTEKLTDFEFRVWCVYRASADDFGVCPFLAGTLKGRSRRLSQKKVSDRVVEGGMQRLVEIGLCIDFEHQGLRYLCQADWQDREEIRHPRSSNCNPPPPPEVFGRLTEHTQELFRNFHPKCRVSTRARGRETLTLTETPTQTLTQEESRETKPQGSLIPRGEVANWGIKHGDHVTGFCDWMCFPNQLCDQFAGRLPGVPYPDARRQVEEWALGVREAWRAEGRIPAGKMFDWWNDRWTETHGSGRRAAGAVDPLAGVKALRSRP